MLQLFFVKKWDILEYKDWKALFKKIFFKPKEIGNYLLNKD